MELLRFLVNKKPVTFLALPTILSILSFIGGVLVSMSDGEIDSIEFHNLLSSANGIESIILLVFVIFVRGAR